MGLVGEDPNPSLSPDSWTKLIDLRDTKLVDAAPNQSAMWARRRDGRPFTPVAMRSRPTSCRSGSPGRRAGWGRGRASTTASRFRPGPSSEWVLIEVVGDFAAGATATGRCEAWSQDGELLGTRQPDTAAMRYLWAEGEAPQLPIPG